MSYTILEKNVVDKLRKIRKWDFSTECITAQIWLLGGQLSTCHQIQVFQKLPNFLRSYVLKALRQPSQQFWPKILTPYVLYSNLYLHFLWSCRENIFEFVCIISEKIGKLISQFSILFLASIGSYLQVHWNRKYFSSSVLRLRGQLFMAPWHGFHLFHKER